VNGEWTEWTEWTSSCSSPQPMNGGRDCIGATTRLRRCNEDIVCPVHGGWSQWSAYSLCSTSCGQGTQTRSRNCNSPTPSVNGEFCVGPQYSSRTCTENYGCIGWSYTRTHHNTLELSVEVGSGFKLKKLM